MDVKFETIKGRKFIMEVGFFDEVRDVKEKIEKYHGFDKSKITLFNQKEKLMQDSDSMDSHGVLEGSTIKLMIDNEQPVKENAPLEISVRVVMAPEKWFDMKVDVNKTVAYIKEKIHRKFGIPAENYALWYDNIELLDLRVIAEYYIEDGSELHAIF